VIVSAAVVTISSQLFSLVFAMASSSAAVPEPVPVRVNHDLLQRTALGACVLVGGRLRRDGQTWTLTTTDGVVLEVTALDPGILVETSDFVEVSGTKVDVAPFPISRVSSLGQGDDRLWNEMVILMHQPLFRTVFAARGS